MFKYVLSWKSDSFIAIVDMHMATEAGSVAFYIYIYTTSRIDLAREVYAIVAGFTSFGSASSVPCSPRCYPILQRAKEDSWFLLRP